MSIFDDFNDDELEPEESKRAVPQAIIDAALRLPDLSPEGLTVLEPACDMAPFCAVSNELGAKHTTGLDLKDLPEAECNILIQANFLNYETRKRYDLIMCWPPWADTIQFIEQAFRFLAKDGRVIVFQKMNILGGLCRYQFWKAGHLTDVITTHSRVVLDGSRKEMQEYGFFVFTPKTDNSARLRWI